MQPTEFATRYYLFSYLYMSILGEISQGNKENDLCFTSTQMQGSYEDSAEAIHRDERLNNKIQQLQMYSLASDLVPKSSTNKKKITKQRRTAVRRANNTKKIKSLSSHVAQIFGNIPVEEQERDLSQQSILRYFSGKKHKIKDILNRLEKENEGKVAYKEKPSPAYTSKMVPYEKEEWISIMEAIKDNLPTLSNATKRTLYDLTKHIEEQNLLKAGTIIKETQSGEVSLWERASYQPSIELTPIDIKTLYDLNSDQMTIRDATQASKEEDNANDEVPDSCSEPELIDVSFLKESKEETHLNRLKSITSHQVNTYNSNKVNVLDSITSLQFGGSSNINANEPIELVEISSDREDRIEINSSPVPSLTPKRSPMKDDNTVISSSVRSTPSNMNSRITTPTLFKRFNVSPIKLTPPSLAFSNIPDTDETESLYATALSKQPSQAPKRYKTRIVKVSGDIKFSNIMNNGTKIRKIQQESNPQDKADADIIENSDDEDNSISLIELTTIEDEDTIATKPAGEFDITHSVIQVPSSQGTGDNLDTENVLDLLDEKNDPFNPINSTEDSQLAKLRYSQMSASQLRGIFKGQGFKSVKTKEKMITILTNAEELLNGVDATQVSRKDFNDKLFSKLTSTIKSDFNWHQKIASYEPIIISELQEWLNSVNVRLEADVIERYCDSTGICFTNKENSNANSKN